MPWGGPREADAAALLLVHGLWDPTQARLRDGWWLSNLTSLATVPVGAWSPCQWLTSIALCSSRCSERTITAQLQVALSTSSSGRLYFLPLCLKHIMACLEVLTLN